ncbi:hypothetical protein CVIRNUC_000135 [Coccomyxa viridis]|uniref:Uncharacterized protein n=1 Tax=Coccomyxa viridis TaxID=1274662 RepID=A0AAV1HQ33_9CHLO|nr:hypothetical protein CVIRNUC_000135 [Coccomyxa viridis]
MAPCGPVHPWASDNRPCLFLTAQHVPLPPADPSADSVLHAAHPFGAALLRTKQALSQGRTSFDVQQPSLRYVDSKKVSRMVGQDCAARIAAPSWYPCLHVS